MKNKKILTEEHAKSIRAGAKPMPDGTVIGLTLQPTNTNGRGNWNLRFVSPVTGKRRDMGLGVYPDVSLQEARVKASAARQQIARDLDPIEERRKDKLSKVIIDHEFYKVNRKRPFNKTRMPNESVFVENSHYKGSLKKRIVEENLIPYICQMCKAMPFWNGLPLVLVLDHINGRYNDNRLSNLRFLCSNCNSQTDTFSGRNRPYRKNMECMSIPE